MDACEPLPLSSTYRNEIVLVKHGDDIPLAKILIVRVPDEVDDLHRVSSASGDRSVAFPLTESAVPHLVANRVLVGIVILHRVEVVRDRTR
eukprot:scaffold300_cov258-Pinguiococcus_pyrenoidosus.AAC.16